ncbi:MAG: hypothetical protein ABI778_09895 [Ignavibacteriota bacterium]
MNTGYLLICILLPAITAGSLSWISQKHLRSNPLINISVVSLNIFLISRLLYWIGFGILTAGFVLALIHSGTNGEQTRGLIATSSLSGDPTSKFILAELSNYLLPLIFLSLFIAVFALGMIGRKVVTLLPEDSKPGIEFSRFRFTFVLLALSLIIPPLIFGSLLLV